MSAAHIIQGLEAIGFGSEFGSQLTEALESKPKRNQEGIITSYFRFCLLVACRFEETGSFSKGNESRLVKYSSANDSKYRGNPKKRK